MHYNTVRYHQRIAELKKLAGGLCVGCGAATGLQFHHKNPAEKSFDLSREFSRPWEQLLLELAKCELRCEDCHKKQHAAVHGLGMYRHQKCRCDICRTAWNLKTKEYKQAAKARREFSPPAPN